LKPTRVLIADDHRIFVQSLREKLGRVAGMAVAGEACNGEEALRLFEETRPEIAILDVSMPTGGIETARRILATDSSAGIIMLSMHSDDRFVAESLKAGARGYVLKESAFEDLVGAIESVRSGGYFLSPKIGRSVLDRFQRSIELDGEQPIELTSREREVLALIAEGASTKLIASRLGISTKTVEAHRTHISQRLGLHSVAELTKYASRTGLTSTD
jgi:two-component system, NarL family, response regulator NreC